MGIEVTPDAPDAQKQPVLPTSSVPTPPVETAKNAPYFDFDTGKMQTGLPPQPFPVPSVFDNAFKAAPEGAFDSTKTVQVEPARPVLTKGFIDPVPSAPSVIANVESASQVPVVMSTDISKSETPKDSVFEDLLATQLVRENPEKFIKNGTLDMPALKTAKLVNQLNQVGIVDKEVISAILEKAA